MKSHTNHRLCYRCEHKVDTNSGQKRLRPMSGTSLEPLWPAVLAF